MSEEIKSRVVILSRDTLIPIGVAIAIVLPAIGGWSWLSRQLDSIDRRLEKIEGQSNGVMHEVDFNAWLRITKSLNPSFTVPELH